MNCLSHAEGEVASKGTVEKKMRYSFLLREMTNFALIRVGYVKVKGIASSRQSTMIKYP